MCEEGARKAATYQLIAIMTVVVVITGYFGWVIWSYWREACDKKSDAESPLIN